MKPLPSASLRSAALSFAFALAIAGCAKHEERGQTSIAQDIRTTAKDVASEVKTKTQDAWDQVRDFAYEQRGEFSARVRDMQEDMDRKVRDLSKKSPDLSDAAAREKAAALRDYEAARANFQDRMNDLRNASATTWAESKAKVSDAWVRLKASFARLSD